MFETEDGAWGWPLPRPLPVRWRTEDPSVPTVLPRLEYCFPACAYAPHPTRPCVQGAEGLGLAGGRLCAHKGCPRLPGPGKEGVGVKDGLISGWGWGAVVSHGWRGRGGAAVPFFLNPPGRLPIAAAAGCPTLFRCSSERAVEGSRTGRRAPRGSGGAGASTAAPRRALRAFSALLLLRPPRSRPKLVGKDHGQRLPGPQGRINLSTLTPVRTARRTREAVESREETATLLNSPCGEQSSAKYLGKGFPERSPRPLFGRGFGDGDCVDYIQRVKRKEKGKTLTF